MSTEEQASKRRKTEAALVTNNDTPELPPIPVFSTNAGIYLNEDVMEKIFVEMLDPASYCAATALSKTHKAALIPRQTHVWIGGFQSLESFLSMNFVGMEFISFRDYLGFTDAMLQAIADQNRFPLLEGVDFTRTFADAALMASFIDSLGPRLKKFVCLNLFSGSWPSVVLAALARCSQLSSLHSGLVLFVVDLSSLTSLKELSLVLYATGQNQVKLPPKLLVLHIKILPYSLFMGNILGGPSDSSLPNLERLEIIDPYIRFSRSALSAGMLIAVIAKCPKLKVLVLNEVSAGSTLYTGRAAEQEDRLFAYLKERGIKYVGPEHVTAECGATHNMLEQWRDRFK